ncbi:hypothetical protein IW150_003389 [Coemansia sp. RSA 2607]|nr:hypothetical protein IW150_003389 [Coemansia sp. RSA 2607]
MHVGISAIQRYRVLAPSLRLVFGPLSTARLSYSTSRRGRETVQFPWVWPADANSIPPHSNLKTRTVIPFFGNIFEWYTNIASRGLIRSVFDSSYLAEMRDKMVSAAFVSMTEAISNQDYDMIDQIMSPHLARVYRRALENIKAQGFQLKINVENTLAPQQGGQMINIGPPDSFNKSVPFSRRLDRYAFKYSQGMCVSVPRPNRQDSANSTFSNQVKSTVNEWTSIELWYKVPATVKVDLWKGNKLIDSDRGKIEIPITFSTPFYEGIMNLGRAFKEGEDASDLEPFRWFISDIFNIVDMKEVQQIQLSQKPRNE